jgi:signal transduction histidine kinase
MKTPRSFLIWAALVICGVTICAAMAWQTRSALAAERDRVSAQAQADLQEKMRLALWRMDTLGATLILEESNTRSLAEVRERFRWQEDTPHNLGEATLAAADFQKIFSSLQSGVAPWSTVPPPATGEQQRENRNQIAQKIASSTELQKRNQAIDNSFGQNLSFTKVHSPEAQTLESVVPRPTWLHGELFLFKAISNSNKRSISGTWIDLTALRTRLLAEARDLLPAAQLLPAETATDDGLVLASFPLRLDPGALPAAEARFSAPVTFSLIAGWIAAVIAIAAAAFLVHGIMRLSERRASFVSAVTHELRTPLTTFRLYSDMLESGAVKESKRSEYLRVLSREADRLSHLVENVLAFSQIERGNARSNVQHLSLKNLLEPMRERWEARLATAGMELKMDLAAATAVVRVDSAAVEHVLFNLIDNAAKYASRGSPPQVDVSVEIVARTAQIHVRDHGPGIPSQEQRRIFQAFHKSAAEAAESRPGVGLGLALSRRLAKSLGGTLECKNAKHGAWFFLCIPLAPLKS